MSEESKTTKCPWWKPSIGVTIFLVLFGLWWGVPTLLKWRADVQVRELCAKDGGVKVYETVTLPPEMFNQWGQINFYDPRENENALGPAYIYIRENSIHRKDYPEIRRFHSEVHMRIDGRILGEATSYSRIGGDPVGPWHNSSFTCPPTEKSSYLALFKAIFLLDENGKMQ